MHILHACPGIITISACVLRVRDYYFSGELASFPLPRPCIEKRQRSIISRQMFAEMLLWKFVRRSLQTFCRKYSNILDALFIQCGCAAIASAAQESPTRFSKKQKQEGKKKYRRRLSLHARWTAGTFRLEDFSFRFRAIFYILDLRNFGEKSCFYS